MKIKWVGRGLRDALRPVRNAVFNLTGCFKEKSRKTAQYCRLIPMRLIRRARRIQVGIPFRAAIIIATCICASLIVTPSSSLIQAPVLGEPASETIISPVAFKVMDEEATYRNRDEILKSVRPVYDFDDEAAYEVLGRIAAAFNFMRTHAGEPSFQRGQDKTARLNGSDFRTVLADTNTRPVERDGVRMRFESMLGAKISGFNFSVLKSKEFSPQIETDLKSLVMAVVLRGIVASRDSMAADARNGILLLRKSTNKFEYVKNPSTLFELREAIGFINSWKSEPFLNTSLNHAIRLLAMDLVDANIRHNPQMSLSLRQTALWSIKPLYSEVAKGETIIRKNEPADKGHIVRISGLSSALPVYGKYAIPGGTAVLFGLLFLLCSYSSDRLFPDADRPGVDVISSCLLFLVTVIMVHLTSFSQDRIMMGHVINAAFLQYLAPVAAGPMFIALLHNARRGFVFAALISAGAALALNGDIRLPAFYFLSGIIGVHCVGIANSRIGVLGTGIVIGVNNLLILILMKMISGESPQNHLTEILAGFCGGALSGAVVYLISPVLEATGRITRFKLFKLADPDHPLMKQIAIDNRELHDHSLKVANLAQVMAEAINACVLSVRVGGLYHDIGKFRSKAAVVKYFGVDRPQGFEQKISHADKSFENETLHAALGEERAKKLRLPRPVSDIIVEHHGTALVNLPDQANGSNSDDSSRHGERYAGPVPQTKEAGLVMVAEILVTAFGNVAGASPGSIRKRVVKLVMGLFNDGQLNESGLTLRDLDTIIKVVTGKLQENSRLIQPFSIRK